MLSLDEAAEALRNPSSGLQDGIISDIGCFTVALLGVFESPPQERLELAGTGTLVRLDNSRYILTARHVWDKVLQSARGVGITLKANTNHKFVMDTQSLTVLGPEPPQAFSEWGPDLALLRVPPEHFGTIDAYKSFYNLSKLKAVEPDWELETHVLMGTPWVQGSFTQTHADLNISGFFVWGVPTHTSGDLDYLDVSVDVSLPEMPHDFGGVSGGGFWKVMIRRSDSPVGIDWRNILEGLAFYQSAVVNGRRTIRCHGQASIQAAILKASA
jgi:hypothetical protein